MLRILSKLVKLMQNLKGYLILIRYIKLQLFVLWQHVLGHRVFITVSPD